MADSDHEYSFFCQYDTACEGGRAPNIHELRVAIASLEVPVSGGAGEGFLRFSTIYGCEDSGSNLNIKWPERGVQANIRVKQVSTESQCLLFIGDEGVWFRGVDLLTGHEITPLPSWTNEDRELFDEVYDYETQFLRYSSEVEGAESVSSRDDQGDPYVTTHDLTAVDGLDKLEMNGGTTLQYFTPNFSFSCLYEYSPYWNLSTSFIAPAESDDSGADDEGSVVLRLDRISSEKRLHPDRSPVPGVHSKTPSPQTKRQVISLSPKV